MVANSNDGLPSKVQYSGTIPGTLGEKDTTINRLVRVIENFENKKQKIVKENLVKQVNAVNVSQELLTIDLNINSQKIPFLVDTASQVNIISTKIYNQLRKRRKIKLHYSDMRLMFADGSESRVKGVIHLKGKIGNDQKRTASIPFVVAPTHSCLLGLQFLDFHKAVIRHDLSNPTLTIMGQEISLGRLPENTIYCVEVADHGDCEAVPTDLPFVNASNEDPLFEKTILETGEYDAMVEDVTDLTMEDCNTMVENIPCSERDQKEIATVLYNRRIVFGKNIGSYTGYPDGVDFDLDITALQSVIIKPRSRSWREKKLLRLMTEQLEKDGVIEKCFEPCRHLSELILVPKDRSPKSSDGLTAKNRMLEKMDVSMTRLVVD